MRGFETPPQQCPFLVICAGALIPVSGEQWMTSLFTRYRQPATPVHFLLPPVSHGRKSEAPHSSANLRDGAQDKLSQPLLPRDIEHPYHSEVVA